MSLTLVFVQASERCQPCRDMKDRIDRALAKGVHTRATAHRIRTLHADRQAHRVRALGGVKVIPALLLIDDKGRELFRSEGRVSEVLLDCLLDALASGVWDPRDFSIDAPAGPAVFSRTYARRTESGDRETYPEAIHRVTDAMAALGKFTPEEKGLVLEQGNAQHTLPSGRWLWVGGTAWILNPTNFSGAYNCTSTEVSDLRAFGLMMDLAMMGSGTGAVLEDHVVAKLPPVRFGLKVTKVTEFGSGPGEPETRLDVLSSGSLRLTVGDSRRGWVDAYQSLIDLAMDAVPLQEEPAGNGVINLQIDLRQVRPPGTPLKGFGGTANPVRLPAMFRRVARLLTQAKGRQLTPVECCLLIDEAAAAVVAGNIRRSAGMRQFTLENAEAATAKDSLYTQDAEGNWKVDPERENLRMANHTLVAHRVPSLEVLRAAVRKQFHSGEGAIQYAPAAIARANVDVLDTPDLRAQFLAACEDGTAREFMLGRMEAARVHPDYPSDPGVYLEELAHRLSRYGLNPCGEIIGKDFHCNLAEVHLNTLDPADLDAQAAAFRAAGLQVAALLHHQFQERRYAWSRELDPIVGVSFTGLFDFFVEAFGVEWLAWMMAGRPDGTPYPELEAGYLSDWREVVHETITGYCQAHGLRVPNRMTTVQPAGTKSLLTGASSGWHPPKAQRFIRRITFGAYDPVALACIDYGFRVIPAQSARDEEGNLLDDTHDPRVTEWLVEVPTQVAWADIPGADAFDLSQLSAAAQFGLYMQVQRHYTDHNTSATIEFREHEIDELAELIHGAMVAGDYVSAALLARFDANATFPRLPFQPITLERYEEELAQVENRRTTSDFYAALRAHDSAAIELSPQESACTSAACTAAADKADREGLFDS